MRKRAGILIITALGLVICPTSSPGTEPDAGSGGFGATVELPQLQAYAVAKNRRSKRRSNGGSPPRRVLAGRLASGSDDQRRVSQRKLRPAWTGKQRFLLPALRGRTGAAVSGKAHVEGNGCRARGRSRGALYRATVLNVLTRLRVAYNDYYLAQKSIEIVRSNEELLGNWHGPRKPDTRWPGSAAGYRARAGRAVDSRRPAHHSGAGAPERGGDRECGPKQAAAAPLGVPAPLEKPSSP